MFSTCVARGIAAKLVYRTVGGKVETSLYCSTATPAAEAASIIPKRGRKRPDNERRRMRREAWRKRNAVRTSSAAATAAATTAPGPAQCVRPAVTGGASSAPPTAAAPPPRTWAWEPRDSLLVVARRLQEEQLGSPESSRGPEYVKELNISCTSLLEEREREESCSSMETPLSYAAVAARPDTPPVAADPGVETPREVAPTAEERTEVDERAVGTEAVLVFQPPPTPPPWSKFLSSHHKRVLCTECFAGNREICSDKCSDCYRSEWEVLKKKKELQRRKQ
jgi:hypothetical protein